MKPMSTAPKDGTRILIKTVTYGYDPVAVRQVPTGDQWIEARWAKSWGQDEQWVEWCGNEKTQTTNTITPLGWVDRPDDELEPEPKRGAWLSDKTFARIADEVVPGLREGIDELTELGVTASPTLSMIATLDVKGREERVRIAVTLNPDEAEG